MFCLFDAAATGFVAAERHQWRTGWDLNPRHPCGCTAFPVLRLRPDSATRPRPEKSTGGPHPGPLPLAREGASEDAAQARAESQLSRMSEPTLPDANVTVPVQVPVNWYVLLPSTVRVMAQVPLAVTLPASVVTTSFMFVVGSPLNTMIQDELARMSPPAAGRVS